MLDIPTGNSLLHVLAKADAEILLSKFEPVDLKIGEKLYKAREPIKYAYFPLSGICSIIAENEENVRIETGLIGREGFIGIPIVLFVERAASEVVVQAEGRALRISRRELLLAVQKSPALNKLLLNFAHVFSVQVAQTAVANGHNTIHERLARWLLMCQDRAESHEFPMTHQFLSAMLAVRRAGITEALIDLEGKKAIRATRGHIIILNRAILEQIAGAAYGTPEAEYKRVITDWR
jgi:CRP-like cAMP-binding protein